jgi:phosphomevalonate kinase
MTQGDIVTSDLMEALNPEFECAPRVTASCPGKVLISGGYLVLDEHQQGNVVALSARLRCHVTTLSTIPIDISISQSMPVVIVASQRLPAPAMLVFNRLDKYCVTSSQGSNVFLDKSVLYALQVANFLNPSAVDNCPGLALNIVADDVFYSGEGKTGLGSSACLVSSLAAAILRYFEVMKNEGEARFLEVAHNLAQFVHCAAQGKVGSGFDVSTAFFGSQTYQRFSPSILEQLLLDDQSKKVDVSDVVSVITSQWNTKVSTFKLPPQLDIILADVRSGSETPSMVKKVLQWKKEDPEANSFWNSLGVDNRTLSALIETLRELYEISPKDYAKAIYHCQNYNPEDLIECEHPNMRILGEIREHFLTIRRKLKDMGRFSGVEIEPESQSNLLDACMRIPGVLFAGVPGAGGFDAIFLITLNSGAIEGEDSVLSRLEQLWKSQNLNVTALDVHEDGAGMILSSQ